MLFIHEKRHFPGQHDENHLIIHETIQIHGRPRSSSIIIAFFMDMAMGKVANLWKDGYFCKRMESKQMNIGLVTWFGTSNYGTNLQAYALYKALEERGYNVQLIKRFKAPFSLRNIKDNFFYAHGIRRFWKYGHNHFPEKKRLIRRFCREEMKTARVYTERDLKRLLRETDIFMAGSDQLWNCHDHFRGFEFLDFATGKKKISYGTSIGTAAIPADLQNKVKDYLSDYKYISLREQSGASSIATITGRDDITTVLDPVLLQNRAFWEAEAAKCSPGFLHSLRSPGYVLYYILKKGDAASAQLKAVEKHLTDLGTPLRKIIIPSGENPHFSLPGATVIKDAGIREFIALVKEASLVVTDSYHGTALSIVLERQFINLKRFSDSDKASQNIRFKDLLDRLGIDDRNAKSPVNNDVSEGMPSINYDVIRPRLEQLRAESNLYLDKALSDAD